MEIPYGSTDVMKERNNKMNKHRNISEMKGFYSEAAIRRNAELPASAGIAALMHGYTDALPYCRISLWKQVNRRIN
jgi:hypothetical protein